MNAELLNQVFIAAPCNVSWESMKPVVDENTKPGADTVRFCQSCSLNVYNLSGMTSEQAENLLQSKGEKICASLYRRTDGTVLTDNCPVGLRRLRDGFRKTAKVAASVAALVLAAFSFGSTAQGQVADKTKALKSGQPSRPPEIRLTGMIGPVRQQKPPADPTQKNSDQPTKLDKPDKVEKQEKGESRSAADGAVMVQLLMAQNNDSAGNFILAEAQFKEALKLSADQKHDPKLRQNVAKTYAEFLRKHERAAEAAKIEEQAK